MHSIESQMNKALDKYLAISLDNIASILAASTLTSTTLDPLTNKNIQKQKLAILHDGYTLKGSVSSIVKATENILSITQYARQAIRLNDFESLNQFLSDRRHCLIKQGGRILN